MSTPLLGVVFLAGAVVSLGMSWVLVSRIERMGSRIGASEAVLGLMAALAADTPEITSAISALTSHQGAVGAGVVVGSNVFNLAALLGLSAIVAGSIRLHRRNLVFQGVIAVWVAIVCVCTVVGVMAPVVGLVLVVVVLAPYVVLAAREGPRATGRLGGTRLRSWLRGAIAEEEVELSGAVHPRRGRASDVLVGVGALAVVVTASVVMEHAASAAGRRLGISGVVIGGVVLAAVTSLPNAVAAVYLARRGRGAATLSTALNSNALNIAAGLLIPGSVLGLGATSGEEISIAAWYAGLTVLALLFAYRDGGLRRDRGWVIVSAYLVFLVALAAAASGAPHGVLLLAGPSVPIVVVAGLLARSRRMR